MMIVIAYDINTSEGQGQKRLLKVSKLCESCGTRVQNSVFEIQTDPKALSMLKHQLLTIINSKQDSIRIYNLGKHYRSRIEILGMQNTIHTDSVLII